MSLDAPAYLSSLQNNIRARPISWEGAVRAKTITDADLKKIRAIDKVRKEQRRQTVEDDLDTYTTLLLGDGDGKSIFETTAKRADILLYMLVLTNDLIDDVPALTERLISHQAPFKPFLPLLKQSQNPEDQIPLLTSSVLASLLSKSVVARPQSSSSIDEALPKLYSYIATLAQTSDSNLQDIAVQEYSAVLRTTKSRKQFWSQRKETLSPLIEILKEAVEGKDSDSTLNGGSSTISISGRSLLETSGRLGGSIGLQLLYHVLLVVWQLSFEGKLVGKGLDEEYNIVALYASLARASPKEKTTRLILGTLRNLLEQNKESLMAAVLPAKLPTILNNLKSRHLTDPDLIEDLEGLRTMMDEYTKTQTTFESYAAEVNSGHLRWSPPHRSEEFWRENAQRVIEDEKGELCKKLAEIMSKDWQNDKQVLAIACNDVGALVKYCPDKRQQLEKFGLKGRVMGLMQDESETVRWESLRAVGEWLRYSFNQQ